MWWAREDSNLQPSGYEPLALTIELRARATAAVRRKMTATADIIAECHYAGTSYERHCERSEASNFRATRQLHHVAVSRQRNHPRRLSKNTACSPNKFQNHHGIFSRILRPQALSATASSILAPATSHNRRKSLMLQKWMFGVSYQA